MFAKIITVACALAGLVQAAGRVEFTKTPAPATIGQKNTIMWNQGNGDPVTIILRQGDPDNLKTLGIIASNVEGYSYDWVPSSTLSPSDDYALEITQDDDTNYSSLFSLVGGANSTATTILAAAGSTTVAITTITPNSTTITATAVLTGGTASGTGTGVAIPRNTTFSSQTLGPTSSSALSTTGSSTPSATAAGNSGSSTAPAPSPTNGAATLALKVQGVAGLGALFAAFFML